MEPNHHRADQAEPSSDPASLQAYHHQVELSVPQHLIFDQASNARCAEVPLDRQCGDADLGEGEEEEEEEYPYAEGVPSPMSVLASAVSAPRSAEAKIQYDTHDHTLAAPSSSKMKKRVWVLPRALLPTLSPPLPLREERPACSLQDCSDGGGGSGSTRSSTQSTSAGAGAVSRAQPPTPFSSPIPPSLGGRGSAGAAAGVSETYQLPARVVRLPHPRQGEPTLYLIHANPAKEPFDTANAAGAAASSSSLLFEIQAQAPPNDFAQSWFVKEEVVPSKPNNGELLLVTPVDLTYFALSELLGDAAVYERLSHVFMSAGDLYQRGAGQLSSSLHPPSGSPQALKGAHAGETEASGAYVSVFGGIGGDSSVGREDRSSSSSTPYSFGLFELHAGDADDQHNASHQRTGSPLSSARGVQAQAQASSFSASAASDRGWSGWAHAAAHYPLTFNHCFEALKSDAVLRRFCEVREVNGDGVDVGSGTSMVYYRPAETVAVAWLKRKVELLRASAVLREMLQLSEMNATDSSPAPSSSATSPSTQQASAASAAAPSKAATEVPLSIAYEMVAEYVPERLHGPLAVACGLPDPSLPSTSSVAPSGGVKRAREGDVPGGVTLPVKKVAVDPSPPAGLKSASVRRLEKAGRPKGTPTLLSMFAKKRKDGE
ncbi:hypothetical protein ABL78_8208 [Leptomonas seymouri]|uniref:Rnh202 triple barrel domain-containing protein n=1 Tax=Leptomonas seymouri TaxID=5684 RepID=A0A0N0P2Q4_LEPSE|nr:hypothetical protein ABL78_8208 [Leptomonas seymouri]|eukprot:KPI82777.1 hypothetical protein ABL78_8208 [Leptomonas seymouri]